jgi:hypothetical protein
VCEDIKTISKERREKKENKFSYISPGKKKKEKQKQNKKKLLCFSTRSTD